MNENKLDDLLKGKNDKKDNLKTKFKIYLLIVSTNIFSFLLPGLFSKAPDTNINMERITISLKGESPVIPVYPTILVVDIYKNKQLIVKKAGLISNNKESYIGDGSKEQTYQLKIKREDISKLGTSKGEKYLFLPTGSKLSIKKQKEVKYEVII